jgi:uncharacterized protein YndB with AHSA1/START domain
VRRRDISVDVTTSAPPEIVYGLLADGSTWPTWCSIDSVEVEQAGDPPPEGVGAIRVNRRGRTVGRDQILELVPNRKLKYTTLSGLPFREYVGEVDLTPVPGGGTAVNWHSSFFPKVPGTGWVMERGLRRFLQDCATGLAEHAAASIDASRDVTQP